TGPCGDRSTAFYNPFRKKWVFSLRCKNKRARDYVEHDDFLTGAQWTEDHVLPWADADRYDEPGAGAPQLYNLDAVAYESVMLGLFEIFKGPENYICEQNREPKHTELMSAFSRDGFHWHRPDRTPFIPADRRRGAWEYGYVQSTSSVCLVVGDELWFYYIGFAGDRWTEMTKPRQNNLGMYANGATGLAKLRRDGFASFEAGVHSGKLTTRHVVFQGTELFVNVNTKGGQFRAEVLDGETGQPLPGLAFTDCDGFTGNSTRQRITWNGKNLASLAGKPVRFRFELTRGAIYAFWVSPDASGKSMGYLAGGGPGYDRIIDD
ncbi:MAG: glycosyl hydrolase family 32, partial [bacterium]